jgi:2-polyprenyl-3-methyl-5-hydroxy-6-metoxy-1,4-benzoquinol methylase
VEHYEKLSPAYVNLGEEQIDEERIWCQSEHKSAAFQQWLGQIRRLTSAGNAPLRLLDIGCGTGGFLRFAQNAGFDAFGFDSSKAQIEFARRYVSRARTADNPFEYLELLSRRDLRFDIVTMWDVLEHMRNPLEVLKTIGEIIMPRGLVYICVPNGRAMVWKWKIRQQLRIWDDYDWAPWEHVFYFSIPSLTRYLGQMGFTVLDTGAVVVYPRPMSMFELVRRIGFRIMQHIPQWAPQIYVWARGR